MSPLVLRTPILSISSWSTPCSERSPAPRMRGSSGTSRRNRSNQAGLGSRHPDEAASPPPPPRRRVARLCASTSLRLTCRPSARGLTPAIPVPKRSPESFGRAWAAQANDPAGAGYHRHRFPVRHLPPTAPRSSDGRLPTTDYRLVRAEPGGAAARPPTGTGRAPGNVTYHLSTAKQNAKNDPQEPRPCHAQTGQIGGREACPARSGPYPRRPLSPAHRDGVGTGDDSPPPVPTPAASIQMSDVGGVPYGARTRDLWFHRPALCRLS